MISLTEDKVHSIRFDVEWDLFDKIQDLIDLEKSNLHRDGLKAVQKLKEIESLMEKRYNLISCSMVFDSIKETKK